MKRESSAEPAPGAREGAARADGAVSSSDPVQRQPGEISAQPCGRSPLVRPRPGQRQEAKQQSAQTVNNCACPGCISRHQRPGACRSTGTDSAPARALQGRGTRVALAAPRAAAPSCPPPAPPPFTPLSGAWCAPSSAGRTATAGPPRSCSYNLPSNMAAGLRSGRGREMGCHGEGGREGVKRKVLLLRV